MINGSPSDSYQIMLLFLLGEKYYPKQMRLIRKRKAKEIQEKKGKQKKKQIIKAREREKITHRDMKVT